MTATQPAEIAKPPRVDSLTAFRFLAAAAVLLFHLPVASSSYHLATSWGRYGVDFFFILSGFVLAWSFPAGRNAARFYGLRFARVWPLHAITFCLAAAVGLGAGMTVGARNLALVHAWWSDPVVHGTFNTPSWTLSCEAFFYALFPWLRTVLAPRSDRTLLAALIGSAAAMATIPVIGYLIPALWPVNFWFTAILPLSRLPQFIIGMCVAMLVLRGRGLPVPSWAAVAAMGVIASGAWIIPHEVSRVWLWQLFFLAPLVVVIWRAGQAAMAPKARRTPAWLVRLGDWSFAMYLVHYPIFDVLHRNGWVNWWQLTGAVTAIVALSGLLYHYVEQPVERALRRRVLRGETLSRMQPEHSGLPVTPPSIS